MSSDFSLTSIICESCENSLTNCAGSIERIFSVEYPADFQLSIPESKYPIQLSKPTLDSLVIASSSFPFSTIKIISWFISFKISPTQGANLPLNPIKIEPGMCSLQ